jgi:adenylate cyclase
VRIFELMAEGKVSAQVEALLTAFNEGFALYHEKRFSDAIERFKRALDAAPDDAVSQLYIKRCEDYLASAPPDNWDGVCVMKEK